ncbi:TonB-dependent receptor plug domain-containing protein [Cupriavidus basilensis]
MPSLPPSPSSRAAASKRAQPVDETGLFADEPDIDVPRDRRRFGAGSINIRGIEANRVLLMVDGVRLPDYYNGGGPSNLSSATRDAPEFSFLKRVEVLRGPASSLYGSDAIGGVVSYVTKDPEDLMRGRAVGGEAGLSWNGIDRGFGQTAGVAGGNDTIKGLSHVRAPQGATRWKTWAAMIPSRPAAPSPTPRTARPTPGSARSCSIPPPGTASG